MMGQWLLVIDAHIIGVHTRDSTRQRNTELLIDKPGQTVQIYALTAVFILKVYVLLTVSIRLAPNIGLWKSARSTERRSKVKTYDIVNPCPYFQGRTQHNNHHCIVCAKKPLQASIYPIQTCIVSGDYKACPQYRIMKICEIYKNKKEN